MVLIWCQYGFNMVLLWVCYGFQPCANENTGKSMNFAACATKAIENYWFLMVLLSNPIEFHCFLLILLAKPLTTDGFIDFPR